MEKNQIWLFTRQLVYNYGDGGIYSFAFSTKEKAVAALNKWREDERPYIEKAGWKIDSDDETCFSAFEEGNWCNNHTIGFVEELTIDEQ